MWIGIKREVRCNSGAIPVAVKATFLRLLLLAERKERQLLSHHCLNKWEGEVNA